MSANADERLVVMLEARVTEFERRMRQAEGRGTRTYQGLRRGSRQATQAMERDMVQSTSRINQALNATSSRVAGFGRSLVTGLVGGLVGGLAVGAVVQAVRQSVASLATLANTARDTGVDVEELQGIMRGFANAANVSEEEVGASLIRFNRRIGEAVSGGGPLQTTLDRYRINIRRANGEMKTQAELLRDVAQTIRNAGTEQERLAIAQAAFGDSGRRMAQAMIGGSDAIDRMVSEARAAGDIIDRNLIHRAEILDNRFNDLTRSVGQFFKALAVTVATGGVETPIDTLERLFGSLERARAMLGDGVFQALIEETGQLHDLEGVVANLEQSAFSLHQLSVAADTTGRDIETLRTSLMLLGQTGAQEAMEALGAEMAALIEEIERGDQPAAELEARLLDIVTRAGETVDGVGQIDGVQFGGVIGRLQGLIDQLRIVRAEGEAAAASLPGASGPGVLSRASTRLQGQGRAFLSTQRFLQGEGQQAGRTREQIALENELAAVQRRAREIGITLTNDQAEAQARLNIALAEAANPSRSGGGRDARGSEDFTRAIEGIRQRTAELQNEALAIAVAAESNREYGSAMLFAQERARLLSAAQRQGLTITPELTAQIDTLADAYVRAGEAARNAAEQMEETKANAERGAEAMSDLFMGILEGGDAAKKALAQLLMELARVQMMRAMTGLAGSGGLIGGMFSFLGGGLKMRAGGGPVSAGSPYLVNERTPRSEVFVPSQSGGVLNVPQAQAALRDAAVGGAGSQAVAVDVRVGVDDEGKLKAWVEQVSQSKAEEASSRMARGLGKALPGTINRQLMKPRNRGR